MAFGDLDSVTTTSMQDWSFGSRSITPEGKTENLFETESVDEEDRIWIPKWRRWNNIYRTIPEIAGKIDTLALWIIGVGWESPKKSMLEKIRGNGIDIFDSIMMNLIKGYLICGDSFGEIIEDKAGRLVNLKPLTSGDIRIRGSKEGMIKGYEQISGKVDPITGKMEILNTWKPDKIFHLAWNRQAMEIHGISSIEKLDSQIKKINIAKDITTVIHRRHAVPVKIWEVDEDDTTKVAAFQVKVDNTFKNVENIVVPMGAAKATILQMQKGSIEEGISLVKSLDEELTKGFGVPNVTQGSESGSSEATSKILHLNFQPRAKWHREFIEKQFKAQVRIKINFKEPPSIDPALLTDARKNTGDSVNDVDPSRSVK